ncbi:MAG: DUF4112 domain-containing protein [Caulobacteraceae bacterium]
MKPVQTLRDLESLRDSVQLVGKLSDSVVGVGPFSIGLDGVLSWIPGLGEIYSAAAGTFIIVQGARAGVSKRTLAAAGGLMLSRTAISAVPLAGPLAADMFMAHKWSAKMVAAAIDRKIADQGGPLRGKRGFGFNRFRPTVSAI